MKNYTLFLFLFFGLHNFSYSCSYIQNAFCVSNHTYPEDVLITGKIIKVDTNGITMQVIEVLRGSETRDTIRIWDIPDLDCNGIWPMAASTMGSLNDSIIATLPLIDSVVNPWDVVGDYKRPKNLTRTCELQYSRDSIYGFISGYIYGPWQERDQSMEYNDFKNFLNTSECQNYVSVKENTVTENISLFPNPVESTLELSFNNMFSHNIHLEVFSSNGKRIYQSFNNSENTKIDFSSFSSGLYFVRINHENMPSKTYKIMKR